MLSNVLAVFFSFLAIVSALGMILQRYMIYSIALMIVVLLSISGLFLTLNAPFLALVQAIVYAGAVMVMFVFSAMIIGETEAVEVEIGGLYSWFVALIGVLFLGNMMLIVNKLVFGSVLPGNFQVDPSGGEPVVYMGELLFTNYYVVLQSLAIIILVALVGAIYLTSDEIEVMTDV